MVASKYPNHKKSIAFATALAMIFVISSIKSVVTDVENIFEYLNGTARSPASAVASLPASGRASGQAIPAQSKFSGPLLQDTLKRPVPVQKGVKTADDSMQERVDINGVWISEFGIQLSLKELKASNYWADVKIKHNVIFESEFIVDGVNEMLLIFTSGTGDNCHACAPDFTFFEFKEVNGGWQMLEARIPSALHLGEFGNPFIASKIRIGKNADAVLIVGVGSAQGYDTTITYIYSKQKYFIEIFKYVTGLDYSAAGRFEDGPSPKWNGELRVIWSDKNLYDIELIRVGNKEEILSDFHKPIKLKEIFRFRKGLYRPLSALSDDGWAIAK